VQNKTCKTVKTGMNPHCLSFYDLGFKSRSAETEILHVKGDSLLYRFSYSGPIKFRSMYNWKTYPDSPE